MQDFATQFKFADEMCCIFVRNWVNDDISKPLIQKAVHKGLQKCKIAGGYEINLFLHQPLLNIPINAGVLINSIYLFHLLQLEWMNKQLLG